VWGYTDRDSVAAQDGCPRGLSPAIWGAVIGLAGLGLMIRGSILLGEDSRGQLRDGILWLFGGLIALLIGATACCFQDSDSASYLRFTSLHSVGVGGRELSTAWDRSRI